MEYVYDLIHDSVKQATDMGPNFCPINDYFALPPEPLILNCDLNETASWPLPAFYSRSGGKTSLRLVD